MNSICRFYNFRSFACILKQFIFLWELFTWHSGLNRWKEKENGTRMLNLLLNRYVTNCISSPFFFLSIIYIIRSQPKDVRDMDKKERNQIHASKRSMDRGIETETQGVNEGSSRSSTECSKKKLTCVFFLHRTTIIIIIFICIKYFALFSPYSRLCTLISAQYWI